MPRRLLKIVTNRFSRESFRHAPVYAFAVEDVVWVMGGFCALNRKPFDAELLVKQFSPSYNADSFIHAARALGFKIKRRDCASQDVAKLNLHCLVVLNEDCSTNAVRTEPIEACPELAEAGQGTLSVVGSNKSSVRGELVEP